MQKENPIGSVECATAAHLGVRRAFITATVTRADGSVEDLGVVADTTFEQSSEETNYAP